VTELVAEGLSVRAAARQLGLNRITAHRYVKQELAAPNEGSEERRDILISRHEAELTRLATQAARLKQRVDAKGQDAMEAEALLVRNSSAKGKHLAQLAHLQVPVLQKHEHTGADGGPIPVAASQLSMDALQTLIAKNRTS
jgi:hypothetical protein